MSNEIKVSGAVSLAEKDRKLMTDLLAALSKGGKPGKTPPPDDEDDGTGDTEGSTDDDFEGSTDDGDGDDTGDGDGEEEVELTAVAEAMKAYATAKGPGGAGSKALAMKVLKTKGGVDALSKLKPAKRQGVIDACKAAAAALKKKK